MIRVAYICEPQIGGTFSFFQHLRPVIGQFGVELLCVPPVSRSAIESSPFRGIEGIDAIELDEELPHATEQLIGHLQATGCAAVLTLPCCGVLSANLPRYLPLALPCAVRVPMMTRGAYMPTAAVAPWVDRIIAVSDRVASDLVGSYGIATGQVATIFNGVEPADFPARALNPAAAGPLRLVYSGRLSDLDKGVMLLPAALRHLRAEGESFEVTVAGDGPDREKLVRAFETAGVAGCVRMVGAVPHDRIRKLYYEADIFVLPSRFEGCPNALLEAMAAGCAVVAAGIKGSVDRIVEDGVSGLLFRVGDARDLAARIKMAAGDAALRARLGRAARVRVLERFNITGMAGQYARVFAEITGLPRATRKPLPLADYSIPAGMRPTWRTRVPTPIKNFVRKWMERRGWSV